MILLLELLGYTCPLQRRRSQTDGHQGGGTSQELCSPWRTWVTSSEQCFGFVCYRLAPVVLAIVPDPRFFSFFKVNDGSVVAKEERASLLVDQECVGFVKEGLWAEAAQGHLAHRSLQLTDGAEFHLEDMVLPRTSWLHPPCIPHRECRPS